MSVRESSAPRPISMEEAVGYTALECHREASLEDVLVLAHDRLFLLLDEEGRIAPPGGCGLGLFYEDTRLLSHYEPRFAGGRPVLLSAQLPHPYHVLVDLAITDREFGGIAWDPRNSIHIRRELLLDDRLEERMTLTSYLPRPIEFWVELHLGVDFADIFEVRGWRRDGRGQFYAPAVEEARLTFRYRGRDGRLLRSVVDFVDTPHELDAARVRWTMRLEPGTRQVLRWQVLPWGDRAEEPAPGGPPLDERRVTVADEYARWRSGCSRWETDVAEFNVTLHRAVDDLRALQVRIGDEPVISAGIPWYSTVFGRDSLITSLQTLSVQPELGRRTLRYLAAHQGEKKDPYTEEEPGKIMHELRRGELARTGEIPHVPYYGSVDATPLWLILLHEIWRWTGDTEFVQGMIPHAERALEWIERHGDLDGDGFVEYRRTSDKGLENQGWKDSGDGVPYPDGTPARPPIAMVEVQGYVYDAKVRMAALFRAFGELDRAERLEREAESLRRSVIDRFWLEELGTFALALDGEKRPVATITTNAAHLLWSRLPDAEQARRVARLLLEPELFSGWGLRTLSATHPVFNPMSYHNGSVWPHDNALVVLGLCLNGFGREALPVVAALHDAAANMRFHRLPELYCGMSRSIGPRPVLYPVSCSPQAWASGAFFMLLQAVTGIRPDAHEGVLHIREPLLPLFLRELTISRLRIGRSRVSLQFRRRGDRTLANLLAVEGAPIRVHIELH